MGLFNNKDPVTVRVNEIELRCEICKNDLFFERQGQINTAVATFFDVDFMNATARCMVCANCGYVHWFLPQNRT